MNQALQQRVLDLVLDHYKNRADAVEALTELFGLGKDAIYRRLRGDTILTPDELSQLAVHYNLSLDSLLFEGGDKVFFSFNAFRKKPKKIEDFLDDIHQQIEMASALPNGHFYYASMEVPLFHYLYFHEIVAFKLYLWGKLTWNLEFLQDRPFSMDLVPWPVLKKSDAVLDLYNQLPSTELWTLSLIDNTLNQLEYIATIGQFADPEMPLLLCEKLFALLQHMTKMAEVGHKFSVQAGPEGPGASFDLYHNEMLSTNNTILVTSDSGKYLYTTFANPNFLVSTDPKLCSYSEDWLKTTISKSVPIGQNTSKNRLWFFRQLQRKLDQVRSRLLAEQEH
ncbi:MAG: hypothetical protein GYB31_08180 [Bacteroidetes bacterium]|nr:hypothetical protein [Bacteroidota bacterium]